MGGRMTRRVVGAALCAAALPASAFGSLGSVISYFRVADNWRSYAYGVSRDGTYLCWLTTDMAPAYGLHYINYGGGNGVVYIGGWPASHGDADASIFGPGYFADIYRKGSSGPQAVTDYDLATGSIVGSWVPLSTMVGYAYNPARRIRYVNDGNGYVHRYNATGSLLSSFPTGVSGGIGATNEFAGRQGEYIIATGGDSWYAYDASGVKVGQVRFPWEHATMKDCACGPGYPSEYGTTLWCIVNVYIEASYLCQISLHNATAVAPASVGKIKALYR